MATKVYSVLITGANRGIGFEFVQQFLKNDLAEKVVATARDPSKATELNKLATEYPAKLTVLQLEVRNYAGYPELVSAVEKAVGEKGLSLLINNAGMYKRYPDNEIPPVEHMIETFEVNSVTPLMITKAFLPLLKKSVAAGQRTVVANISSKVGSIDDNTSGGRYSYRTSKTALNQITRSLSVDLKPANIIAVAVHPGWVLTDMGGPNALINTETSTTHMIRVLTEKDRDLNGKFINYDGAHINW